MCFSSYFQDGHPRFYGLPRLLFEGPPMRGGGSMMGPREAPPPLLPGLPNPNVMKFDPEMLRK